MQNYLPGSSTNLCDHPDTSWRQWPNSYDELTGVSSITIDLQEVQHIEQVKIWHYFCDTRKYANIKVEASDTGSFNGEQTTVYDEALGPVESEDGITIYFQSVLARYVRHTVGNTYLTPPYETITIGRHFAGIKVYSPAPSSSPSKPPSLMPSQFPSEIPSNIPSASPSLLPSAFPSITPSSSSAMLPTALPPTSTCGVVKCLGCNCCGVGTTFSSITLQCELDCSSTSASCTDIQYDTCYQSPECAEDGCCAPGTVFEDESPQNPILGTCVAPSGSCPP